MRTHRPLQMWRRKRESGLTLIEVLFSIIIFFVGVAGVLGLLVYCVTMTKYNDNELIAKQKLREAMESVYGARNSSALGFESIDNTTAPGGKGVFLPDWQPLYGAGADGIVGTQDDSGAGYEQIVGPDGQPRPLKEFQRRITVLPFQTLGPDDEEVVSGNLKRVQVEVRFNSGMGTRTKTLNALISQYR